ncbi:unnamed protein product [Euphydryas editha]|uniref:Chitin-binding type-2 domain-containing protein n=1 Tax=Euphydryas editha TaxID=104508 RepID=A0AAU9UR92_EUPED|nr:unnamed protein product [Euphydryas editha]
MFTDFVQSQFYIQTTSSFYKILVFVKVNTSDTNDADHLLKDIKNKYNHTVNHEEVFNNSTSQNNNETTYSDRLSILVVPIKEINKEDNIENIQPISKKNKSNITISNKYSGQSDEKSNGTCTEKNERYMVPGSCDRYIECQNSTANEKQCPDGLRYNHNVKLNAYPCQYSVDVQCAPGSTLQSPKPTKKCPNQFGYFKPMNSYNCSSFIICENGIAFEYNCPDGLAFNPLTYRCAWPHLVPDCDVNEFLNYGCPEEPDSNNMNISKSYRSPTDCRIYFSCKNGEPRPLFCPEYFAYDEVSQTCVPAYKVAECTDEQILAASESITLSSNGEYVIRDRDDYIANRFEDLSFEPKSKKN